MNQTEPMQDPLFLCFTPPSGREDPLQPVHNKRLVWLFAEFNSSFVPFCFPYEKKKKKKRGSRF